MSKKERSYWRSMGKVAPLDNQKIIDMFTTDSLPPNPSSNPEQTPQFTVTYNGRTILFLGHDLDRVRRCFGAPDAVIEGYENQPSLTHFQNERHYVLIDRYIKLGVDVNIVLTRIGILITNSQHQQQQQHQGKEEEGKNNNNYPRILECID